MFDGEMVKEIGYRISLSAILVTVLFLSFAVFYLVGFGLIQSLIISTVITSITFLASIRTLENLRKREFQR